MPRPKTVKQYVYHYHAIVCPDSKPGVLQHTDGILSLDTPVVNYEDYLGVKALIAKDMEPMLGYTPVATSVILDSLTPLHQIMVKQP